MFNHEKRRGNCRVKVPSVLQMEAVECGAASLAMILGYYGRFETLEILREQCGVSRDGSKASNILKAARRYGLTAKGYRLELDELKKYTLPMIIHWGFGHFLVLEGFKNNKVYLNDPSEGPRVIDMDELDKMFTGIALVFELTEQFEKGGEKFNPFKILRHKLDLNRGVFYYTLVAGLNLLILGCLVPFYSKIYVDEIVLKGRHSWLKPLIIGMAITAILRAVFNWIQRQHLLKLELKIDMVSSSAFIWHLLRMPLVFFTQRSSGDLNFRMMRNERVSSIVSNEMVVFILNLFMILFFVVMMFHYDVSMTLVVLMITVVNIGLLKYITQKRNLLYMKMIQDVGKLKSIAMSGIQTIETLKATGSETDFFSVWSGIQAKIVNNEQNIGVFTQKMMIVYTTTTAGLNAAILTMGAFKVLSGEMSIGLFVAYQSLMQSFLVPVSQLVNSSATLQEMSADLGRIDDVLRYPEDINLKSNEEANKNTPFKKLEGTVELKNITFGYSLLDPPFIENFSLKMEPGSRVALVGGSGSGKSTLSKLVSGLYEPWSGEVLFDNINRNKLSTECLSTSFAVVDQEICLFRGSIIENISLWDETLPEAEIIMAAKDAFIHEEITERFGNYNSLIDEAGANFSGGQRQRIEIARALALNPSILILDEATSALDPKTEKSIDENIRKRGCTCLIIAHRLSTIRDCDEIIVLEKGQIVQRGTHEEMIQRDGPYKKLLDGQS